MQIEKFELRDDGRVPNHPTYPLLLYRAVYAGDGALPSTDSIMATFAANGWAGAWVNGIYPFHHYHARSHEVLACAGGGANVQFGGQDGPEIAIRAGDVVVIPAGVAHCRRSGGSGLIIVGAYPCGQEDWDLKRDNPADYQSAQAEIPLVARPPADPVTGLASPLLDYWS